METSELAAAIESTLIDKAPLESWLLYQPIPTQPGFLQAPTPNGRTPEQAKYESRSISTLTGAIGIKNHERKYNLARQLTPEQSVYALIEYQTAAIFGGRGNYASQLMGSASGAGSGTPFMGAYVAESMIATFRHDVSVLLDTRDKIAELRGMGGDVWALWTVEWNGKDSLPSAMLDPFFIPYARLVRLAPPHEGMFDSVWFCATTSSRVKDHTGGGCLGDSFAALVRNPKTDGFKVRGALEKGFDYREVCRLLFGAGDGAFPSPAVAAIRSKPNRPIDSAAAVRIVFEGVAYEQGKTRGFHRREVLLQSTAVPFLSSPEPVRAAYAELLPMVAEVKKALYGAARVLMYGSPKPLENDTGKVESLGAELELYVDQIFVERVLDAACRIRRDDYTWASEWSEELLVTARRIFEEAKRWLPRTLTRRYEGEVAADSYLEWKLRALLGVRIAGVTDPEVFEQINAEPSEEVE